MRATRGQAEKEEVRVFYIAYVIRLSHESPGCDETRPASNVYTTSPCPVRIQGVLRARKVFAETKLSLASHLPGLGRLIEKGLGILFF